MPVLLKRCIIIMKLKSLPLFPGRPLVPGPRRRKASGSALMIVWQEKSDDVSPLCIFTFFVVVAKVAPRHPLKRRRGYRQAVPEEVA